MATLFETNISVFRSLFNTDTPFTMELSEVINMIYNGRPELKDKINIIRNSVDKAEVEKTKKSLYAIMFNGTFTERNDNSLVEHSGLCVLDFDKYPSVEAMLAEKQKLQNDPYTLCVFISPSGNGLKALIKIPKSNKEEHKRRFNSYKDYINSEYFDEKNCNLSRVCFESYDPTIYYNPECKVYKGIEEEKGFKYTERVPSIILYSEDKIIDRIMKWNFNTDFIEGERNNYIFMIASHFCEYGVSIHSALSFVRSNFCDSSFTEEEANTTIKSAYKSRQSGIYYFEDYEKVDAVKKSIKNGETSFNISKKLDIDKETIAELSEIVESENEIFWSIREDNKGKQTVVIETYDFVKYLERKGFRKYYPENSVEPVLVYVSENRVEETSESKILDFINSYINNEEYSNVYNQFMKQSQLLKTNTLNSLESINFKMLEDTKDTSYIPFQNGVVKVNKNNIELVKYINIDGYIWKNQIINRDFKSIENSDNDFKDFVSKVSNKDSERVKSLETTLGYLTHTYKDKADQKAIILNDQDIDDNPNGGSGKSLMLTALSHFRRIVKIDGKAFDPRKSDFVYQRVNLDTQILSFDDVKKNFDFEYLFSLITEGITVNRKNKDEIFIPFERSPKIVITTNYVINGSGASHDRRRHELEFYQYFNNKRSPLDVYGRLLFDSWNKEDWCKFDNYMVDNLQLFLNEGLAEVKSINANAKRFIQTTNKDFYDFVEEGNLAVNVRLNNSEIMNLFTEEFKGYKDLSTRNFKNWIKEYANYKDYEFNEGRTNSKRYFELVDNTVEVVNDDEDYPF